MLCFTSNFEDVILQRVLSDVTNGCFIDVGASGPVYDSNTFALYMKGWRGVAIDPMPYQQMWKQRRPEDIFICAAVGESPGDLTMHVNKQWEQLSSGSDEAVEHLHRTGYSADHTIKVKMITLNQVITELIPDRTIHLLSIDVEGMEFKVLKGLDLHVHRPWVLIVEAVLPACSTPSYQEWEPYILDRGYIFTYFDGVNRFYLAQEHQYLLSRFSLPPNVWDNFVSAKEIELLEKVKHLEAQVAELNAKLNEMEGNGGN